MTAKPPADDAPETVTIGRAELDRLLGVAALYLDSFTEDERFSFTEVWALNEVQEIVDRYRLDPATVQPGPDAEKLRRERDLLLTRFDPSEFALPSAPVFTELAEGSGVKDELTDPREGPTRPSAVQPDPGSNT